MGHQGGRELRTLETENAFQPIRSRRATAAAFPEARPWLDSPSSTSSGSPLLDESIRALIATHENERRQFARDLHDIVGQALTVISLHLDLIRRESDRSAIVSYEADEAARLVDGTLRQVRDLAFDIRPAILDDLGLIAAARSWVARQARIAGFLPEFHGDLPGGEPHPEITSACFRALQEAMTNVSRHAAASFVAVSIVGSTDELVLTVRDDGVGFDPHRLALERPDGSLGLLGTRELIVLVGGRLTIESAAGHGTTFQAWFPLHPAEALG